MLAVAFGLGLESFFLVLTVIDGARDSLIEPLSSTVTGPLRVTNDTTDLGAGRTWPDYREMQARLQTLTGGTVVARLESNYITIRERDFDNWSAGLLLGIDPARDPLVADFSKYLVWGSTFTGDYVYAPSGRAWIPIVLGEAAARRLNLTLSPDGLPDFGRPLTLTSGHSKISGSVPIPLVVETVVVGVFRTGLEPLDKFTAFIPIPHARYLAGYAEGDPVANTFLVKAPGGEALSGRIRAELGLKAQTASESAFTYMGSMLVVLYAAATLGIALFLVVLVIWLVHETGAFLRADQPVLSTLRAIGIPSRAMQSGYIGLTVLAVAAGAFGAVVLAVLAMPWLPPLRWTLSGLEAEITLRPRYAWLVALSLVAVGIGALSAWATARRVGALNILAGLKRF